MLLITIIVEVIAGLIFRNWLGFFDYVVVLIFCGFTAYDWARAQVYPKTLDNAIDSAADLYMDIINLFVRILSITSSKNDN